MNARSIDTVGQLSAVEHADFNQPATLLARDIAAQRLSSRELLEYYIQRIQKHNSRINAVVTMNLDAARQQADAADAAARRGENLGPLHGIPMTLKDTWEMPGMPCAAGAPEYRRYMPEKPAVAVQRLMNAGAIVFGKTNVPYLASDIQSFNAVYGTTNNPWNTALTPGGSSGGAAAALSAGFTPLEFGSDLAGSIRIPAHYCGVYGHKPTYGVIPMRGHVPGPPGTLSEAPMVVAGPMAQSANDLTTLFNVLSKCTRNTDARLDSQNTPPKALQDYRVLLWTQDPLCPLDETLATQYRSLKNQMVAAGVSVTEGAPEGFSLIDFYIPYLRMLGAMMGVPLPMVQRQLMGMAGKVFPLVSWLRTLPPHFEHFLSGIDARYADIRQTEEQTLRLKQAFCETFNRYDVILMPPAATTAIPHNQKNALPTRIIHIENKPRHYTELFTWISVASVLGLPATSAPVRLTPQNLPVNIQIMGAPHADNVTLHFAELLAEVTGKLPTPV